MSSNHSFFNSHSYFLLLLIGLSVICANCARESGCNDPTALNSNPDAESDDGSCIYSLETLPTTYTFSRQQTSSVLYERETLTQLRINDLYLFIKNLGTPNAVLLTDTDAIKIKYTTADDQDILSPTGTYPALQTQYDEIATGLILRNRVANSFKADSMILSWIDTITTRALQAEYIGTPQVYTTVEGIDLAEMIHKTLLGAVLYANGVSQLNTLLNANNTDLATNSNYTAMEHQWDAIWGLFGAPIAYESYQLTAYQDDNNDNVIDYKQEYAYNWAADALKRTAAVDDTPFKQLFINTFIQGRAAITAKNDTLRIKRKDNILAYWEKLAVANVVHYANALKALVQTSTGTQDPNLPLLNAHWAALYASFKSLAYRSNHLLASQSDALLQLIDNKPPHAATGTPENEQYLLNITQLKEAIQNTYDFSETEMQNW